MREHEALVVVMDETDDRANFRPKPRSMNRVCRRAIDARMRRFTANDIAGARANRRICL